MASITKSGRKWRAQVKFHGVRDSGTFETKAEAMAWAVETEKAILASKRKTLALGVYPDVSLANARQRRDDARKLLRRYQSLACYGGQQASKTASC